MCNLSCVCVRTRVGKGSEDNSGVSGGAPQRDGLGTGRETELPHHMVCLATVNIHCSGN